MVDPTTLAPEALLAEVRDLTKRLLEYGAKFPKILMLFVKDLLFVDGSLATLAPDLDLFSEVQASRPISPAATASASPTTSGSTPACTPSTWTGSGPPWASARTSRPSPTGTSRPGESLSAGAWRSTAGGRAPGRRPGDRRHTRLRGGARRTGLTGAPTGYPGEVGERSRPPGRPRRPPCSRPYRTTRKMQRARHPQRSHNRPRRPRQDHPGRRHAPPVRGVPGQRGGGGTGHGLDRPRAGKGHHHPGQEHGRALRRPHRQHRRHARPRRLRGRGRAGPDHGGRGPAARRRQPRGRCPRPVSYCASPSRPTCQYWS